MNAEAHPDGALALPSKLAEALSKAQGELENVAKAATAQIKSDKGSYSYAYATLGDGLAIVRPVLSKHGLAITHQTRIRNEGLVLLARLLHVSGEWLESEWPLGPINMLPKERGSALTYARRYTLFSLVGIAGDDDDDGEAASAPRSNGAKPSAPTPARPSSASRYFDEACTGRGSIGSAPSGATAPSSASRYFDEARQQIEAATDSRALKEWWNADRQKNDRKVLLEELGHVDLLRLCKAKIAKLEEEEKGPSHQKARADAAIAAATKPRAAANGPTDREIDASQSRLAAILGEDHAPH